MVKLGYIFFSTLVSTVVNTILMLAKIVVGSIFGSISLVADGFDSLLDLITGVFAGVGENISKKPPDKTHLFGHEKYQMVFSLAIALTLIVSSYIIAQEAIDRLITKQQLNFELIILIVALISIFGKMALSLFIYKVGRKHNSYVLVANAKNYRTDAISSIFVCIAMIGVYFGLWWFDPLFALLIVAIILYTSYDITRDSLPDLLDRAPSTKHIKKLKTIVMSFPEVGEVHVIRLRRVLGRYTGDFHLLLDPNLTILEGHKIAERVKERLEQEEEFENIIVHIEPYISEEKIENKEEEYFPPEKNED